MIKEILFIVTVVAFIVWIIYEKYFKKEDNIQESVQELSEDNNEEELKNE